MDFLRQFFKTTLGGWRLIKLGRKAETGDEDSGSDTRQINVESEALEEILREILQGINDLKGGRKKEKGNWRRIFPKEI